MKESPNAYLILMGQKLNVKYFEFIKGNSLLSFALSYFELHVFFLRELPIKYNWPIIISYVMSLCTPYIKNEKLYFKL